MKAIGTAAAGILVPQDYQMPGDDKGKRKKVRPEDLRSGTLFGQYQLRGSILVIKDASTTASGYIAFGTDMTTIPTSSAAGTGVYIDYSGIYGLSSGTKQFYLDAATGAAIAGAGAVTLDVDGITITKGTATEKSIKWVDPVNGQRMFELYGDDDGIFQIGYVSGLGTTNIASGEMVLRAKNYDGDEEITFKLFAKDSTSNTYANLIGTATFDGFLISPIEGTPSSLLHLKSTAPTFRMEDSTASAKSLLVTVDANVASFGEVTGGNFLALDLANKDVTVTGALNIDAAESFGYVAGAGGAVTQNTDKTTGVTLNTPCGTITLNNATLNAATTVSFTLTNSTITTSDVLILNHLSAGTAGAYLLNAQCASGSASINVRNITAGNLGEAIVISFAVVRVATT